MIRATLDTNVLASGLAGFGFRPSTPGAILRHWRTGTFELVVSAYIPAELERTLTKPYYRSRPSIALIEATQRLIASEATVVAPANIIPGAATHSEDDPVLAAAVSASVDYLVTGDKALQRLGVYEGVRIVSPREFLDLLEQSGGAEP